MRQAIINPFSLPGGPDLGPLAILASLEADCSHLASLLGFSEKHARFLVSSRLFADNQANKNYSLAGPVLGAPHAVMVLEQLIARGAREVVFLGWCGSISPDLRAGHILVPDRAFSDEGTSAHYLLEDQENPDRVHHASQTLSRKLEAALAGAGLAFTRGSVWTTDALFRETQEKVDHFSAQGAVAVEMELSALFAVARFRAVEVCGLLVVSDEVFDGKWHSGIADKGFHDARLKAAEALKILCRNTKPHKG